VIIPDIFQLFPHSGHDTSKKGHVVKLSATQETTVEVTT